MGTGALPSSLSLIGWPCSDAMESEGQAFSFHHLRDSRAHPDGRGGPYHHLSLRAAGRDDEASEGPSIIMRMV